MEHSTQSKLFYNGWRVVKNTLFFLYIIIGGRGIGKTYSILKGLLDDDAYFMYVRRTEVELKNSCKDVNNPFTTLNDDLGREIEISKAEDSYIIHEGERVIGVAGSLSTFGKFRGADFSKVQYIIFDEFINTHARNTIKDEADLLFNMIETVNRNKEILGQEPIKVILLANSNRLDNGVIKELKLGEVIHQMKRNKESEWIDNERGIYLALPADSGITAKKKETALYKLTKGSKFYDMAINNEFVSDTFDNVKKIHHSKLTPLVRYENVTFFNVKDQDYLYCSYRRAECPTYTEETFQQFKRDFGWYIGQIMESGGLMFFDYDIKLIVSAIFK